MEKSKGYFDLLSGQRYYHAVAFKVDNNLYSLQSFWRDCGVSKKNNFTTYDFKTFLIEHGKIITDTRYHSSDEDFSISGGNRPPFIYDLFGVELRKYNVLIFGFPFKYLAAVTLRNIIEQKKLLAKGSFVKADLDKLIKQNNSKVEFTDQYFSSHFSSLNLMLTGETNISSVNLEGDKPLESALYRTVFSKKINDDEYKLEKCSLKCETNEDQSNKVPRSKSNIHMDLFGNYKLYIHGNGKNIYTIPYFFNLLLRLKCSKTTLINPVERLKDE